MKLLRPVRTFTRNHKVATVLLCIVVALGVSYKVWDWATSPTGLGPKIEYIGKAHLDCLPRPFSLICINGGYYEYYFATDLSPAELPSQFKHPFKTMDGSIADGTAYGTYQNEKEWIMAEYGLKQTFKKYIISMSKDEYSAAKKAL